MTTTYPTIEPDDNFIGRIDILRWKVPKVKRRISLILVVRLLLPDWHQTSITLTNVKIDIWDCCTVDSILCD